MSLLTSCQAAAAMLIAAVAVGGCNARPAIGIDASVGSDKPIAINLAATQPVQVTGKLELDKPITISVEGLVIDYEGTFIPEPLFGQINEGDSTEYVAAMFGTPDFESKLGDGTLVWRWKYRPKGQSGAILSVFGGGGKSDEPQPDHVSAIAIFKDLKLTKKWRG